MNLARILGKKVGRPSYVSDSRWVLPTCLIGLEHEYEGVKDRTLPRHTFADFWTYHEEGSLKDNGAEYVFSNPLFGVDAYSSIEWLVSHAKASAWKCSKRTGIHVHLDVRDLTVPQFAGMTILYGAVEPILYRWIGDGRASSHFCIPLYRADEALLGTCSILRAAHVDDKEDGSSLALDAAESFQRYAGYNLQALHKFGSVEFRQLQTTHDFQRIADWVNIIMSLKAAAYKLPQSDGAVVRMLEKMDVREVLAYLFPADIALKLFTSASEDEFHNLGLPTARDIAVHGCGEMSWVSVDFPKGENEGFVKWIKSTKQVIKTKPIEDEVEPDEFDILDSEEEDERVNVPQPVVGQVAEEFRGWAVPAPRDQVPENQPRVVARNLAVNFDAVNRFYDADFIPPPILVPEAAQVVAEREGGMQRVRRLEAEARAARNVVRQRNRR